MNKRCYHTSRFVLNDNVKKVSFGFKEVDVDEKVEKVWQMLTKYTKVVVCWQQN